MSRKRATVATSLHLAGNLAPMATGLVTAPMTARGLGVEDRGSLVVAVLVGGFVTLVGAFGLGWVARSEVAADKQRAASWDGTGRMIGMWLAPSICAAGWLAAAALGLGLSEQLAIVAWFGVCALGASRSVRANILIALGYPDRVGVSQAWLAVSTVVAISVLYFCGALNLATAMGAMTLGPIAQTVALRQSWLRVRVECSILSTGRQPVGPQLRRARGAWGMQAVDGASSKADSLVFLGGADHLRFGLYSVAAILPQVCFQVYLTIVQRSYAKNPKLALDSRTSSLVAVCATIGIPLAAAGWIGGELLIPRIFGPDFKGASDYLPCAALFSVALGVLAPVLADAAIRRGRHLVVGPVFLVVVAASCIVAPVVGPQEAVLGMSVVAIAGALVYLWTIGAHRGSRTRVRQSFRTALRSQNSGGT